MQNLFPNSSEISAKALTSFAPLEKDLLPLVSNLNDLKIPSPAAGIRELAPHMAAEQSDIQALISTRLAEDIQHLAGRLDIQISSAIADATRQYDIDIRNAKRKRRLRYFWAAAAPAGIIIASYIFYAYINREVPQDAVNAIIWNLVAAGIGSVVSTAIAKWRDDFPKTSQRILEDSRAILRGRILDLTDEAFRSQEFSSLAESKLSQSLRESYERIISIDPEGWNQIAAERIDALRRHEAEYRRLRVEYERNIAEVSENTASYFSDVSKNLELLNEVAARVKKRAIEPSFHLLAETRASLDDVKNQIRAVEFQV